MKLKTRKTPKQQRRLEATICKMLDTRLGRWELGIAMVEPLSGKRSAKWMNSRRKFLGAHGEAITAVDNAIKEFVSHLKVAGYPVEYSYSNDEELQDVLEQAKKLNQTLRISFHQSFENPVQFIVELKPNKRKSKTKIKTKSNNGQTPIN